MKSSFLLLALFCVFAFIKRDNLVGTNQDLFFPGESFKKFSDFGSFQITTWNNIIVENEEDGLKLCHEFRTNYKELVSKIMCETQLSEFAPLVISYLNDQFLIYPAPDKKKLSESASMEMAKLSVMMGPESENLLNITRLDPLNRKEALLNKVQNLMNDSFVWKNGLLTHAKDKKVIIPIQFSYKPDQIEITKKIDKLLTQHHAVMIGQYEGHSSNRTAIENDLDNVGILGFVLIALFVAFVVYMKLYKLIKLIVPTALGICVSFFITWLIYGSVHAITLAFGTGIIGLAIDYGFHYVFSKDKNMAWKSNLYALLTTLLVFMIFLFSSVPLIRQMMVFSLIGLIASYVFSRLLLINDHIDVHFSMTLKKSKWHSLTLILVGIGIFHFAYFKVDTSIRRFNYTPEKVIQAQNWFYSQVKKEKVFFKVYEEKNFNEIEEDFKKTAGQDIRTEGVFGYVPFLEQQKANIESWNEFKKSGFKFEGDEAKVFAPFTERLNDLSKDKHLDFNHPPEYLSHLIKNNKIITMWFVKGDDQEKIVKAQVKNVDSLIDIVVDFTKMLSREITIFMPITIAGIFALLMFRYRSFKKSFLCLIPFLFSLGFYGLLYRYFNFPLSFMSLMGLFLIYGLSVDYGIFSTDYFTDEHRDLAEESSLNLSLLVNWVSGIVGFLPLLWCKHPILHDLGLVLVVGMFGIFYSTFFVIPALFDFGSKK